MLSQWWLTYWSSDPNFVVHSRVFYVAVFGIVGIGAAIVAYLRAIVMTFTGIRASRSLHEELLRSVLRAPLEFFDTTPIGRLLSRFSKDLDTLDTLLVTNVGFFLMCVFQIVGSLIAIAFATPYFILAIPPAVYIYFKVRGRWRSSGRFTCI